MLSNTINDRLRVAMFKMELQEENGLWHDIRGPDGAILTFPTQAEAHAKLESLYPVITKMEKFAAPKRTRVIAIWTEKQDEDWKT